MNKYQKYLNNKYATEQLDYFKMRVIDNRPPNIYKPGEKIQYEGKNCILLNFVEDRTSHQLWNVHFIDDIKTSLLWL